MNKTLILVVEDDTPVHNLITTTLKTHDYKYISAKNGAGAIMEASTHNPDIVLLDLGLPDIDGVEVIEKIRSWSNMPIIVISARSEDSDKIEALDAGADDYLTKPFSVEELLARLRVTQRRLSQMQAENGVQSAVFENGALRIEYAAGCAYLDGEELHLTPIEYKLLCLLSQNAGKVLTHTFITQKIWGSSWENDIASLRVFMATLRKKLDVHANWFPVNGTVKHVSHQNGRFRAAYLPKSSTENERSAVVITTRNGVDVLARQIAGALARRIVTYAKVGDKCHVDEQMGFIKFGSRVDVYLPVGTEVLVEMDQKVTGNQTPIARLGK